MTTATRFTVTQAPVLASAYLKIQLPTSMELLKKAFRNESKRLHPDKEGGSKEKFQEMTEVYEFIITIAHLPGIIEEGSEGGDLKLSGGNRFVTEEGISIFDLGLGLGPTKNGKDCPRCQHKGYTIVPTFGYKTCAECDMRGQQPYVKTYTCRSCAGTGKFQQKNSRRIVDCRTCSGTGLFTTTIPGRCTSCGGSRRVFGPTGEETYHKCFECRGTGEIEIDNPVLVKGRLFVRR